MMLKSFALAAFIGASSVFAVKCSLDNKCPKETPCCSQYSECGTGAFCLGGCDPRTSFAKEACVPSPVCEDRHLTFESLDRIQKISEYLGDSDKADWVVSGDLAPYGKNLLLTMPKGSVGTVLSSTVYMWYGTVKARLKTSRGRGVVSAFILFSDVKDEIDFEFVGVDLDTAQTNYYFQGIPDYSNGGNISLSDTFNNWHDYEIRWTPDKIEWVIDGQVGRTQERKDTLNETAQNWAFPQTPARVQLSLWPGGLETNPKGTIDWAGGVIDWEAEDIKEVGYFWTTVESVTIECYNGNGIGSNNGNSYTYSDLRGTNDTVIDGDDKHTIASLKATGLDPNKGKKKDAKGANDGKANIPGGDSPGKNHSGGNASSDDGSDNQPSSGSNSGCASGSFCQDLDKPGDGSKSSASILAIIIAGFALYWL